MGDLFQLGSIGKTRTISSVPDLRFCSDKLTLEQIALLQENYVSRIVLDYLIHSPAKDKSYPWSYLKRIVNSSIRDSEYLGLGDKKEEYLHDTLCDLTAQGFVSYDPMPKNTERHWRSKRKPRIVLKKEFYSSTNEGRALREALAFYSR